jgi:mannose-6-phosphate isomerase-like protein (cupin superfamily)
MNRRSVVAAALVCALPAVCQDSKPLVWAPKLVKLPGYTAPHRPHTKLADLKARHRSEMDWQEVVVDDDHLNGVYVSMAPGKRTQPRLHPDTREWWVIMGGQIRFNIDGQESFTASKGWLVQVPYRTAYTMETVGNEPSLRFEVNIAHAKTLYPRDQKPPQMNGYEWTLVRLPQPRGVYDRGNKPYLIYDEIAAKIDQQGKKSGQARFVNDDRAVSNVIYGRASDLPRADPADRGHYHAECAEFWVILAGQIEYKIEGQDTFIAETGDIVYVPKMTFHRPRFYGDKPACRLAMNGYPEIAHLFDAGPQQTSGR